MRAAATMGVTAAASGFVVLLLTVPVVQSQSGWSVTYTSTEICAVKGSTVDINCTYTYPLRGTPNGAVSESFWFMKDSNGVYVDLRSDLQYSGRVQYLCKEEEKQCSLRISDLRESDAAEYKFRFTTNQPGGSWTGSPGVTLSVADLQVQVSSSTWYPSYYNPYTELRCQSSCRLSDGLTYDWYRNHQHIQGSASYSRYFSAEERVSCAVKDYETSRSPSVEVRSQNGWSVTYASTAICAFSGSTVDINCTYTYPEHLNHWATTVSTSFWFIKGLDLRTYLQYSGRVQYLCENNKCRLRISDLRESDSAEYKFRFETNQRGGIWTGSPGVTLSVKDPQLQVNVRSSMNTQISNWTELTCHSSCRLPHHLSYVWYNKHQRVKGEKIYILLEHVEAADSYYCAIEGYERFRSVSAPKVFVVSVTPPGDTVEGSSVTLTCSSDAHPAAKYTWNKKHGTELQLLSEGTQFVFSSIQTSDSGLYRCTAENELGRNSTDILIDVKYPPRPPSVSVTPPGETVEGSSVTLTCSSDANPAAKYTWYKKNGTKLQLLSEGSQFVFSSIQTSDSGLCHCTAENELGRNSTDILIDVEYPPRPPSVSVTPPGDTVEGSSVTLTCSSDANPAAKYTWYKKNGTKLQLLSEGSQFVFSSIQTSDSGLCHCTAENELGRNSTDILIDVEYPPRPPSVSVSPPGDTVEGSSVTLTCSSDANPAADYTWYKENEDSPKASEQVFTIADVTAEHGGNYSCVAQNGRGCHNSTVRLTVKAVSLGAWKSAVIGIFSAVFLGIMLLFVFFLIRKTRTSKQSSQPGDGPDNSEQFPPNQSEEQRDCQYATVHFLKKQTDAVYSNIRLGGASRHEEEEVAYAAVNFKRSGPRGQDTGEDPDMLYSTVKNNF